MSREAVQEAKDDMSRHNTTSTEMLMESNKDLAGRGRLHTDYER